MAPISLEVILKVLPKAERMGLWGERWEEGKGSVGDEGKI